MKTKSISVLFYLYSAKKEGPMNSLSLINKNVFVSILLIDCEFMQGECFLKCEIDCCSLKLCEFPYWTTGLFFCFLLFIKKDEWHWHHHLPFRFKSTLRWLQQLIVYDIHFLSHFFFQDWHIIMICITVLLINESISLFNWFSSLLLIMTPYLKQ